MRCCGRRCKRSISKAQLVTRSCSNASKLLLVFIRRRRCVCTYTNTQQHSRTHTHIHTIGYASMFEHINTTTRIYLHAQVCMYIHKRTATPTHTHTRTHNSLREHVRMHQNHYPCLSAGAGVYVHTQTHNHTHTHTHTYTQLVTRACLNTLTPLPVSIRTRRCVSQFPLKVPHPQNLETQVSRYLAVQIQIEIVPRNSTFWIRWISGV